MSAAAAMTREAPPGFSIGPLTTYADPAEMAAWLEAAGAGHELVYATGPALADHAAKRLALGWQERGLVALKQRRSARAGCFDYIAQRCGGPAPRPTAALLEAGGPDAAPAAAGGTAAVLVEAGNTTASPETTRAQMRALMRLLRRCAMRGKPCPSLSATARELGLDRGPRGRRRAQYLFDRLVAEKRISVTGCGRNAPRVVTVLAAGQAQGKSTKGELR